MATAAEWARRTVPISDGEGVFNLRPWFGVSCEEAGEERVLLGSEGVDSELPAEGPGQLGSPVADQGTASRAGDFRRDLARKAVNTLEDEEVARCVKVQRMATGLAMEHSQAHGALL